ncbi:hypothetical protein [Actinomadura sp. SCN-SB]|uniref:hypothetical protein n=1 Tax=Actinomadura sp. SCN-SB TaxID=3373092 RepID=UPI0037525215
MTTSAPLDCDEAMAGPFAELRAAKRTTAVLLPAAQVLTGAARAALAARLQPERPDWT